MTGGVEIILLILSGECDTSGSPYWMLHRNLPTLACPPAPLRGHHCLRSPCDAWQISIGRSLLLWSLPIHGNHSWLGISEGDGPSHLPHAETGHGCILAWLGCSFHPPAHAIHRLARWCCQRQLLFHHEKVSWVAMSVVVHYTFICAITLVSKLNI